MDNWKLNETTKGLYRQLHATLQEGSTTESF